MNRNLLFQDSADPKAANPTGSGTAHSGFKKSGALPDSDVFAQHEIAGSQLSSMKPKKKKLN